MTINSKTTDENTAGVEQGIDDAMRERSSGQTTPKPTGGSNGSNVDPRTRAVGSEQMRPRTTDNR